MMDFRYKEWTTVDSFVDSDGMTTVLAGTLGGDGVIRYAIRLIEEDGYVNDVGLGSFRNLAAITKHFELHRASAV